MSRGETVNPAEIQFGISNMSLPYPVMFGASVQGTDNYLEQIGADGLEVTPMHVSHFLGRAMLYGEQCLRLGTAQPHEREAKAELYGFDLGHDWSDEADVFERRLLSAHVSFRQEQDDNGLTARFFPKWPESLRQLQLVQVAAGRPLPLVTYPKYPDTDRPDYFDLTESFRTITFQPTADQWLGSWCLAENAPIRQIRSEMHVRGIRGVTWDVFHGQYARFRDGISYEFDDPLELVHRLSQAGLVRAVHLALGRGDMVKAGTPERALTDAARKAFVKSAASAARTREGEMLTVIAQAWRQEPLADDGQPMVFLEDLPQLSVRAAKRDQTAILSHARELIAAA